MGNKQSSKIDEVEKETDDDDDQEDTASVDSLQEKWDALQEFTDMVTEDTPMDKLVAISRKTEKFKVKKNEMILESNSNSKGVYVILRGSVDKCISISKYHERVPIVPLQAGNFFGDISAMFDIKTQADYIASEKAKMLLIPQDVVLNYVKEFGNDLTLEKWMAKNTYLPMYGNIRPQQQYEIMLLNTFMNAPLFHDMTFWCKKKLISLLPPIPVIAYPKEATLFEEGETNDSIMIVARGHVALSSNKQQLGNAVAITYPFLLGEEGLHTNRKHVLSAHAQSPCLVVPVSNHVLGKLQTECERAPEMDRKTMRRVWRQRAKLWKEHLDKRDAETYEAKKHLLQQEVLYKTLRIKLQFLDLEPSETYDITLRCAARNIPKDDIILEDDDFDTSCLFIVLEGSLLATISKKKKLKYGAGDVIRTDECRKKKVKEVKALEDGTLVVRALTEHLQKLQQTDSQESLADDIPTEVIE